MMGPIVLEFEVEADINNAFEMWTKRCALWWPTSHSMSETAGFEVTFEPFTGGRIYETGPDGAEYEWGEVTVWDPPKRIEYWWHIFLDRDKATKVTVEFDEVDEGTIVRLENAGFEVFGDGAAERRGRVESAWAGITGHFRETVARSSG